LGNSAGVQYDQIGFVGFLHDLVTICLELPCPSLQFGFVQTAAQGFKIHTHVIDIKNFFMILQVFACLR
jgi:hypothetical protein